MNSSDLLNYGSNWRKGYTLWLFPMCLGMSAPSIGGKVPPFHSLRWTSFSLALLLCFSQDITKWCKNYTKTDSGFKNHMRNLENFRQAVESPKSWNSMGYFCLRNTFLQLKHYIQRNYLSYFQLLVHQIPYVIFESISHILQCNFSVFFN